VLRRAGRSEPEPREVEAGSVRLNPQTRQVWASGEPVDLTSLEFDVLELLVRAAGRTVSRDELAAAIYQRMPTPYERSLDVHISHLRKKLERGGQTPIRTIRGAGYQFAPVES
jgi:two-component system response regulator CpxR